MKKFQVQFKSSTGPVWISECYEDENADYMFNKWEESITSANIHKLGSIMVRNIHGIKCNVPESYFHNYILEFFVEE